MIDKLLSFVAPHHCSGCSKPGGLLCTNCKNDIIDRDVDGCVACDAPSGGGVCRDHVKSYQKAWWVGERGGALQRLIGNYKFQHARSGFGVLSELLDARLPALPDDVVLVPVPTASAHIRERGYDQVLLVAKHFASLRGLRITRAVERASKTTQRHASRSDRFVQAAGAFRLSGSIDPSATYVIVDDVVTTGATIESISHLLRQAGASRIWVAALARQPLD